VADLKAMLPESVVKYNHTFEVVHDLKKKGVVTGVCSNHGIQWFDTLAAKNNIYDTFDKELVVISQAVKCWKPQQKIFEEVEKRLKEKFGDNYKRNHVIFLDDKQENVSSASKFGWTGFVYDARVEKKEDLMKKLMSVEQFKRDVLDSQHS